MHETTIIEIDGQKREVDKELAPLILELKRLGIKTLNSCQGDKNHRSYISIQLDRDTRFDFYQDKNVLTIRWNPAERRGKIDPPWHSFIHTKDGKMLRAEDIGE